MECHSLQQHWCHSHGLWRFEQLYFQYGYPKATETWTNKWYISRIDCRIKFKPWLWHRKRLIQMCSGQGRGTDSSHHQYVLGTVEPSCLIQFQIEHCIQTKRKHIIINNSVSCTRSCHQTRWGFASHRGIDNKTSNRRVLVILWLFWQFLLCYGGCK